MNIVFVSREYPSSQRLGGIGCYVQTCARYMSIKGHNVHVVAASDDISKKYLEYDCGVVVHRLDGGDFYISDNRNIKARLINVLRHYLFFYSYRKNLARYLDELIDKENIDIIEFPEYGAEHCVWQAKASVPYVTRLHGPTALDRNSGGQERNVRNWLFAREEANCVKGSKNISSPSLAMTDWFKYIDNTIECRTNLILNSISGSFWQQRQEDNSNKKDDKIIILGAGTIVESKGFGELVEAIKILKCKGYRFELILAGRIGRLGRQLLKKIDKDSKYKGWLKLTGLINRQELRTLYHAAHICMFPSWWEPFGLTCIEAMASGAITVGSSAGGMGEIIEHGKDGFLVEPHSHQVLVDIIEEIMKMDPVLLQEISKNARKKSNKYAVENVMTTQLQFYQSLISEK